MTMYQPFIWHQLLVIITDAQISVRILSILTEVFMVFPTPSSQMKQAITTSSLREEITWQT